MGPVPTGRATEIVAMTEAEHIIIAVGRGPGGIVARVQEHTRPPNRGKIRGNSSPSPSSATVWGKSPREPLPFACCVPVSHYAARPDSPE